MSEKAKGLSARTLLVDVVDWERARAAAAADDRSLAAWVRRAIAEKLEREGG